jgi:hypothetical protein
MSKKIKRREEQREQDEAAERAGSRGMKVQVEVQRGASEGGASEGGSLGDDYGLGDEDEMDRAATQFDATDKLPEGNRKRVESAADSAEGGMTIEMTELQS